MINKLESGWSKPGWMNYALLPVSWLYIFLHNMKVWTYWAGLRKVTRVKVPVIVIGGISVGGSGKTPLVISIVKHLKARGYRPGVISRGYKGKSDKWPRLVTSDTPVREVGDEAMFIHVSTALPVVVGPDRVQDAKVLIENSDCDVIVSDDGFQHLALYRDLNIAIIDSQFGFGNGWCLPAGPLREPIHALKRADIRVRNGSFGFVSEEDNYTMDMKIIAIRNLADGKTIDPVAFKNNPVHVAVALGNPERFFRQLEELGFDIIRHRFADHHFYRPGDLMFDDELPILLTEKDAIKCHDLPNKERLFVVEAEARVDSGFFQEIKSHLDQLTV